MLSPTPPYPIWVVWRYTGTMDRLFFLGQAALVVYSAYCSAAAAASVPRVRAKAQEIPLTQQTLRALRNRSVRVQRSIRAAFYTFGAVFFAGLQWAYVIVGDGRDLPTWIVLKGLETEFIFAFNVFVLFLILEVLSWFLANRVEAYSALLNQPMSI